MAAFLFFLVLYAAYGGLIYQAALFWPAKGDLPDTRHVRLSSYFWLACLLILLCLVGYAAQERWARSHDHAGYYLGCVYVARDMLGDLFGQGSIYLKQSIEQSEYNALLCFLVAPLLKLAGYEIPTYTGVLGFLGVLPLGFLATAFWRKQALRFSLPSWVGYGAGAALITLPALYQPLLQGMADVALLPLALILLLGGLRLLNLAEEPTRKPLPLWLILSILTSLFLLPLMRRYFAIFTLAWFPSVGLGVLVLGLLNRRKVTWILRWWGLLAVFGGVVVVAWYYFFPGFFHNTFIKQYADVYQAYRTGTFLEDIGHLWYQIGPFAWVLALAGAVVLTWVPGLRAAGVVMLVHALLTVVGVLRIQSFSPQHYYLAVGQVGLLIGAAIVGPAWVLKNRYPRIGLLATLGLAGLQVALMFPYTPWSNLAPDRFGQIKPLASTVYLFPRIRSDMSSIRRIVDDVDRLNPNGQKRVYVAGSGADFNDDIFRNLGMPDQGAGLKGLLPAYQHAHVDRRDPFPAGFLTADLVVVPVPMQYHLAPKDQRLAAWVQHTVTDTAGLGRFYHPLAHYPMQNGYEAILYERTGALPMGEVRQSLADIARDYADYPAMTTLPQLPAVPIAAIPGDGPYGVASLSEDGTWMALHPGKTLPSRLTVAFEQGGQVILKPRFETACEAGASALLAVYYRGVRQDSLLIEGDEVPPLKSFSVEAGGPVELRLYPGPKEDFCDRVIIRYDLKP